MYRTSKLNMLYNYIPVPVYCIIICPEATVPNESYRTVWALKLKKGLYIFIYCITIDCKVGHPDNTFSMLFDILPWEVIYQKLI